MRRKGISLLEETPVPYDIVLTFQSPQYDTTPTLARVVEDKVSSGHGQWEPHILAARPEPDKEADAPILSI